MRKSAASILLITVFTACLSFGSDRLDVKEHFLDNGMKVLLLEDHSAPLVAVQVWVRIGGRDDPAGMSGVAHLIEHMMFKGTSKMKSEEFSEIIQRYGGTENAGTGRDNTSYFAYVPSSRAEEAMRLWADIMDGAGFRTGEFLSERDVVLEELRLGLNDPYEAVFDEVTAVAFSAHPYGRPVVGWMSDVRTITRDRAYNHYKTFYVPNNMTLVVAGDISEDQVKHLARKYFGRMKRAPNPPEVPTAEPEQTGERRVEVIREALLPMVSIVWRMPAASDPDVLPLEVLAQILAGGESSILHKELVYEKQICTSVSAWPYRLMDPGLFYITCMVASGHTAQEAEEAVYEILERLKSEPVMDRELEKAANQYVSNFVFRQESILRQAFVVGYYDALLSIEMINRLPEMVKSITKEQIKDVANKYLTKENRTVATLVPRMPKEPEKLMRGMGRGMSGGPRR